MKNIGFGGTELDNVVLSSLQVILGSGANYVALDNFSYTTQNIDPEIELRSAGDVLIASGSDAPSTANGTDFEGICLGSPAVSKTVTIKNLASVGTLTLSGSQIVTLSGSGATHFSVTSQPSGSVGPLQSTTFVLRFNPSAAGTHTATVSIANNDLDENPYTFTIRGTGNAIPLATITAASQVCQTADLALSIPSAGTGAHYTWTGNGITAADNNATVANPTSTGTVTYNVTVQDGNGCAAAGTAQVTVNASSIPSAHTTVVQNLSTGTLFANSCAFLAKVVPSGSSPVSGSVTVSNWIETSSNFGWVPRHYEITPATAASTSTGTVTLYFTQGDFDVHNSTLTTGFLPANPSASTANVQVVKFAGTSSPNDGLPKNYPTGTPTEITPTSVTWNSTLSLWAVTFNVTNGFSGFLVKSSSQPLPVTLISFNGKSTSEGNVLNWVTADEKEFSHFEVTRSMDAKVFEVIGRLDGAVKQSTQLKSYTYTDVQSKGETYYRLKMIDRDGTVALSKIITVNARENALVVGSVYPNPVIVGRASVDIYAERKGVWEIQTLDLSGRIIHTDTQTLTPGLNKVEVKNLVRGLNLIQLSNGDQKVVRKVVKD